jgi:hypothetical protein
MYSVDFILNDYIQFQFVGPPGAGAITLNCYVWPLVLQDGRLWHEDDFGYADVLRRLAPGVVVSTSEATGTGLRIDLDTGTLVIHPERGETWSDIAEISGFPDQAWMVWRAGEGSFEDLA